MKGKTSKNTGWKAVADLGTNTFQLLIAKLEDGKLQTGLRKKTGVKLGGGGMDKREIQEDAKLRARLALLDFKTELSRFKINPKDCTALGTSVFRNANNQIPVIDFLKTETGIEIEVISGEEEASLIFNGVLQSGAVLDSADHLILDIGGGSVEFIFCRGKTMIWKKSFEIGGLRLIEKFQKMEPVTTRNIQLILQYLESELEPLIQMIENEKPEILVGCSGSFDTLIEMKFGYNGLSLPDVEANPFYELNLEDFTFLKQKLLNTTTEQRLKMPGMIPLRAEMIVVATILIDFVIQKMTNPRIHTSTFAMKEGLFFSKYGA